VADKTRLYTEARRVLRGGGRIAIWDITSGGRGELEYPLPWADHLEYSHLATSDELRSVIKDSGFAIEHWNDHTDQAAALMQTFLTLPANTLGLHAFVNDFAAKAANLTAALIDGRLRVIQGVARAVGSP
jgi:sarcosine/dimethylglycine N-methyltransferase